MQDDSPSVEDVLITASLDARPRRPRDCEAEVRAFTDLSAALAAAPRSALQMLTDVIVRLCVAGSAGVSIVRDAGGTEEFYWPAVSGAWADKAGGAMPIDASPCGTVIARDASLLFDRPERHFPSAMQEPLIHEILLVPFHVDGRPIGTLWAVAHDATRRFDAEDARFLTGLAKLASVAYQLTQALDVAEDRARTEEETIRRQAIDDSERRYRAFVTASADAVFRMSPDWTRMRQLHGRGFLADLATATTGWMDEYVLPDDRARVRAAIDHALATKSVFELEHRVRRADGTPGWTLTRAVPVLSDDGVIVEWIGTARDRTDLRDAEDRLRASEEKYRTVFDSIDEGFAVVEVILDAEGKAADLLHLEANRAYERHTGLHDIVGKRALEIVPEGGPWLDFYGDVALSGQSAHNESYLAAPIDRWIAAYASRIGGDGSLKVAIVFDDITERKRTEMALRENAEELRYTIEANPYATWTATPQGEMDFSSDRWRMWTGSHGLGTEWHAAQHPDDLPAMLEQWMAGVHDGTPVDIEHRVRMAADGGYRWMRSRAFPRFDDAGQVVKWYGTTEDIDDRKRAEDALRESEERLRQFGDNSPDTLWVADARTGTLEYLSAAYEKMWGEPRERVMNDLDHWRSHIHPADRARVAAGWPSLLAGERHSIEYRIIRPDGEQRWIFDTGFAIKDDKGRVIRLAGVAQDLTARREAEDRVAESERRFRTLSEGVPQLVWRSADDGRWTWASPQWTAFTGQREADSRDWGWLEPVHADDRATTIAAWDRARMTGIFEAGYRLRHARDGRYRWFTTRATAVRDDRNRLVEWLGTSTDVDDLTRLQAHQQLLLGELQHRVRNSLAVIRSIARRSSATANSVEDLSMHLDGRLAAFTRTQAAVTRDPVGGLDLTALVFDELLAHGARHGEQADVSGPEIRLTPKVGETLGLAFHELATNAVKYGALSVGGGRVRVSWRIDLDRGGTRWLAISWDEARPGVPLTVPTRRGFGTELLEDTLGYELDAETLLVFRPEGLLCTISIPLVDGIVVP